MSKEFFVIFPDPLHNGDKLADWVHLSVSGDIESSGFADSYSDMAAHYAQCSKSTSVLLVLPAERVISTSVVMPLKGGRQMMQALPYMVEEGLAEDIDRMHLAAGNKSLSGRLPVALVQRDYLARQLDDLADVSIEVDGVYSEAQLPRVATGSLLLLLGKESALFCSEHFFASCEPENLSVMLDMLFEKSEDSIEKVVLVYPESEGDTVLLADQLRTEIEATQALPVSVEHCNQGVRAYLLQQLSTNPSGRINLMQGTFGKGDQNKTLYHRWLPLAWAAVICLALQISFNVSMGYYFQHYSDVARNNMQDFYARLFPGELAIKPRSQMEGKLMNVSGVKGQSGFSRLIGSAALAHQAAGDSAVTLRQFRYEARQGQLTMELSADSIAQLDVYKQHILDAGFSAEILSASEEGNRINARLKIGGDL